MKISLLIFSPQMDLSNQFNQFGLISFIMQLNLLNNLLNNTKMDILQFDQLKNNILCNNQNLNLENNIFNGKNTNIETNGFMSNSNSLLNMLSNNMNLFQPVNNNLSQSNFLNDLFNLKP